MGLEFLARVRRTSLAVGLLGSLAAIAAGALPAGLAFAGGLAWCLLNLALLQWIVLGLTAADRTPGAALARLALGGVATLAMFAAGALLLLKLPQLAVAAGFSVPFAVMALKAASRMLLASPAWSRITRSAWTGVALLALAVGAAWAASQLARPVVARAEHGAATAAPHETPTHATATLEGGPAHTSETPDSLAHAAGGAHHDGPNDVRPAPHGEHGESGHAEKKGPAMFPNLVGLIADANHDKPWAQALHHFEYVIFAMLVALVLALVTIVATRNPQMIPGPLQNLVETFVEGAYGFFVGILGPRYGPRFVPFLGTLGLYIWAMNFFGTLPFMHSPTANLNITVAMALTVFGYVQFTAFRELGVMGWLDHMAGQPRSPIGWGLVPLMLPVHLIGELAKPISLSCRLFGNIFGEDMLLVGFATLGVTALAGLHAPLGIPLQLPFMFLGVFITQPVQALVFTMLSTVYFLLMLPHDHGHGHGEDAHTHAH